VSSPDSTGKHKAQATIYLGRDRLVAGEATPVAVVIDIAEGWHLNANPPRPEFVIPTEVTVTSKQGAELTDVSYPAGRDFRVEGIDEPLSVYERRVVIRGSLRVPREAAGQTEELTFTLRYQACNDRTCTQPQRLVLSGSLPVAPVAAPARAVNAELFAPASLPSSAQPASP
jgi:DsbC/DsbD-like thiol-disulfide interchange protein